MTKLETLRLRSGQARKTKLGLLLAVLLLAGALPARAQLWLTYGEAADFQGEPGVRVQVYHVHGMLWCVGYLYLTKTRIGYEVTGGPGNYSQDSFVRGRDAVLFQISGQSLMVQLKRGRRYDLMVVRDIGSDGSFSTENVSSWPLQDAWDNFDQALERARTHWDPNKPVEEPKPAAPEPPKTATLQIEAQPGGAEFYVDDEFRGTTSSEGRIKLSSLAPGEHRLRLSRKGYEEWARTVNFEAGENRTIEVTLAEVKAAEPPPPPPPPPEEKTLALEDVLKLLEAGVTPVSVETIVKDRGVSFALTPDAKNKLRALGATDTLLLAIAESKK